MKNNTNLIETSFHVRYAETDAMGIVHHGSYVTYFEEGRSNYLRQQGTSYAEFEKTGYYLLVTDIHLRYHKPAHYDDRITVRCWISQFRSRSLTFAYEIANSSDQDLLVSGESQHMCVRHDGTLSRLPSEWAKWLVTPA